MEIKQPQAWSYDGGFDVPVTENRYENTYTGWWYIDPSEKYENHRDSTNDNVNPGLINHGLLIRGLLLQ